MDEAYSLMLNTGADPQTGGIAICGFSGTGMVGVISTSHIINTLDLNQIGTVMNADFPAVALVHDEVPKHPVRVYQGEGVGVFTSELAFPQEHDVQFGNTVLEWFTKGGFAQLIVIDGIARTDVEAHQRRMWGVGSTPNARRALRHHGIEPITQGVVSGITGYLLSEGDRRGLEVTALMCECAPMFPDARAATLAVEAVGELTGIDIPLTALIEDARRIEDSVRDVFESSQSMLPAPKGYEIPQDDDSSMFG